MIHPELGDNLTFERTLDVGEVDKAAKESDAVVEQTFLFGRHTGVCNEGRAILADWNPGDERLTVYHATQAPHMMQNLFAKHLDLAEHQVRVVTKDVGGSFGIKVHTYADEMAVVALSKMLKRPIKFVADRLESFVTDIHARDHRVKGRIGINKDGTITFFEIDDLTGIGPYSVYPRTSGIEANQVVNLTGGPYACPNYRARARVVFQNKNVMCQYRAVGHPIAVAVTEGLVDLAAAKIGMDPVEVRKKNLYAGRCLSGHGCLGHQVREAVAHRLDRQDSEDDGLQGAAGGSGGGAREGHLSRHRLCVLHRGNQSECGVLRCRRRENLGAGWRDRAARRPGRDLLPYRRVRTGSGRRSRDRAMRGVGLRRTDGQGPRHHGRHRQHALWRRHLGLARGRHRRRSGVAGGQGAYARMCSPPRPRSCRPRQAISTSTTASWSTRERRTSASASSEVARICYFRPDTLPPGFQAEMAATRHYVPRAWAFSFTNGIQASYLEVDTDTGFIKLLKHWCVEDCGTIINPQLVDEQVRGGIVQGLGGALFEHCLYDERGQMLNGNMADYLVPMAMEMPDMEVGHVVTPTADSELGAKGAGEAGTAGAPACVMNAINDALRPLGAKPLTEMPFTPGRVLRALGKV